MVFFTCNACGESLKKGQVEKHTAHCRNCQCLSCIDCGKDFWGDDYKSHLKCISEDQKYGGKTFEAKANKGDVKQQQWIQRIHEIMNKPNITPNIKNILNQISTYDNIPRKKAKFQNWMKNSLKIHNQPIQDQVWEIFSEATSTKKEASGTETLKPSDTAVPEESSHPSETMEETKKKSKRERKEERQKKNKKEKKDVNSEEHVENGTKKKGNKRKMEEESQEIDEEDKTTKKIKKKHEIVGEDVQENCEEEPRAQKKKRKHAESQEQEEGDVENSVEEENDEENSANKGKFNWKGTIRALLRQAPDNELPIKKLRKKVIAQYYTVSSAQHKSEEELLATFNKKINGNPKFRVLKERVKLIK
ncbi:cell growth-regulating nucleolar protein [Mantella aurantiaca]